MLRQIKLLVGIQLCNLLGVNEFRFTKDSKKKGRFAAMAAVRLMVVFAVAIYTVIFSVLLIKFDLSSLLPIFLFAITSIIILFFSFFKAGSVIFQINSYELFVSLPVSKAAIVISRFMTMYITNLGMSLLVMLPGILIYGIGVRPEWSFYVCGFLGILILPMLPITLSTAVGALATAVSSRMRQKSVVMSFLTLIFAVVLIIGVSFLSGSAGTMSADTLKKIVDSVNRQIRSIYPPAAWFSDAALGGDIVSLCILVGGSILVFVLLIYVLQKYFVKISSALNASSAKKQYKMRELEINPPIKALCRRELKRYLSSSVYVGNTMIGYILMVAASAFLLVFGVEKLEKMMELPHIIEKIIPVIYGFMAVIAPITSCAISMEGKQWWIAKTLPISRKDIFKAKILLNLLVAFPFWILASALGAIALRAGIWETIWLFVIPAVYILFTAVAGIFINLMLPVMEWENDTRVVKQSASVMVTMMVGAGSMVLPLICLLLLNGLARNLVLIGIVIIMLIATEILYKCIQKRSVISIE